MGAHYGPWPGPTLRRLLDEGNLFSASVSSGAGAAIANMYPPPYFRSLDQGRQRVNAPVHAALTAGLQLRQTADFEAGQAVSADLTGEYLARMHPGSRVVSPEQSGRELRSLAGRYGFTFFDFWLSDQVGHRGTLADAEDLVRKLARFLAAAVEPHDDGVTVIVTSDHGNLEDKSVRTHTRAPVPLLVSGPAADQFAGVTDLTGVAPAVSRVLGLELSRPDDDERFVPGADQQQQAGQRHHQQQLAHRLRQRLKPFAEQGHEQDASAGDDTEVGEQFQQQRIPISSSSRPAGSMRPNGIAWAKNEKPPNR